MGRAQRHLKADIIVMLALFAVAFGTKLYSLNYPLTGDANFYLAGAENIYMGLEYNTDDFESVFPPMFSAAIVAFMPFFGNPVHAIKICSFLLFAIAVILTYMLAIRLGFRRADAALVSLLLAFNPWFFYFAGILAYAETIAVVFVLLGLLFFSARKGSVLLSALAGLFFSFSVLSRYTMVLFGFPFGIYCIYQLSKGMRVKQNIAFLVSASIPGLAWFIGEFVRAGRFAAGYSDYVMAESSQILNPVNFAVALAKYLFVSYPIMLMVLLPFAAIGAYRLANKAWRLIMIGCLLNLLFYSAWTVKDQFQMIRFILPTLPFLTMAAYYGLMSFKTLKWPLVAVTLLLFVSATAVLNIGQAKEAADKVVKLSTIYAQKSYHKTEVVRYANSKLPENAAITMIFDQQDLEVGTEVYAGSFFRKDIRYYLFHSETPYGMLISESWIDEFSGNTLYIISAIPGQDAKMGLAQIRPVERFELMKEKGELGLYMAVLK